MKKVKKPTAICFIALIFAIIVAAAAGFGANTTAKAATGSYDYHFVNYDVVYDIESDKYIHVSETMEVSYDGTSNTGFNKYFYCVGREIYRKIEVKEKIDKQLFDVVYYVENGDFGNSLWVDIGDDTKKSNSIHTYVLTYEMGLVRSPEGKDNLELYVINVGGDVKIDNFSVTIFVPEGFEDIAGSINNVDDNPGEKKNNLTFEKTTEGGKTKLFASGSLEAKQGISFKATFENGTLSDYLYFTPYWFVIAGAALFLIAAVAKLLLSVKSNIAPVVCFEPPQGMDPLMMGKLIDNKVNPEDISSMIYYWADKGYLKINFDDKNDPVLLREVSALPANRPDYEQLMFTRLFGNNYEVHTAKFDPYFAGSVPLIKKQVDAHAAGLNDTRTMSLSIIIAIFSGLLAALAPLLIGITQINPKFLYIISILMIVPVLVIYALTESVWYNRYKLKKYLQVLCYIGVLALSAAFSVAYVFLMPDYIMPKLAKGLLCLVCFLTAILSVSLVSHTKKHRENLRQILGFKKFIVTAEKPQLEKMLEENPEFFYRVLPYAQVLGVSDKWEDKFKNIAVEPPRWASSPVGTVLQFHFINSAIKVSSQRISSRMITRSVNISNLGGHGGFGGHGGIGGSGFGPGR